MIEQCNCSTLANCCVSNYTPVETQPANNLAYEFSYFRTFSSLVAHVEYTSNMAAWFHSNEVTPPHVLCCVKWCEADVKPVAMTTLTSHSAPTMQSVTVQQQQQQHHSPLRIADDDALQPRHADYGQSSLSQLFFTDLPALIHFLYYCMS